jgi:uncharacterized protein
MARQPQPQQQQQPQSFGEGQQQHYGYDDHSPSPGVDDADDFFAGRPGDPYSPSAGTGSVRDVEPAPSIQQPLLDQSHLRPGNQAALLSHERTLELYRANAKKARSVRPPAH